MRPFVVARVVATWLLTVGLFAACTSAPLDKAPAAVKSALDPFTKAGYSCIAPPSSDTSAYGQWQCSRTSSDGVAYAIVIDANDTGIKNVLATVDQSSAGATKPEVAATFFSQVTDIDMGTSGSTIKSWVASHLTDGG